MFFYNFYNEISHINKKVTNIAQGGCAVFAYNAYQVLRKLGYYPKIVVMTNRPDLLLGWINGTSNKTNDYLEVHHVVLELDGLYFDNNGVYDNLWDIAYCGDMGLYVYDELNEDVLLEWITKLSWNPRFNWKQGVPIIEEEMKNCYNKFLVESK